MAIMKRGKTIIFVREAATEDLGLVPGMYGPVARFSKVPKSHL